MRHYRQRCGLRRSLGRWAGHLTAAGCGVLLQDIRFVPLKQEQEFSANELMEFYQSVCACAATLCSHLLTLFGEQDQKLKAFLPIIEDSLVYPVIYDARRTVLSLPPIINGAHSAINLATKNVFIECTATDLTKAHIVLNIMVTMFSEHCAAPFTVEPVDVVDALGNTATTPDLACRHLTVGMDYVNRCTGASRRCLLCPCLPRGGGVDASSLV